MSERALLRAQQAPRSLLDLKLKEDDKDFHVIDPARGKYQVNFEVMRGRHQYVPENLVHLSKILVDGQHCKTWISPDFLEDLPLNCNKCYEFTKWFTCQCPGKRSVGRDAYQRMKADEDAKRRKRQQAAASDAKSTTETVPPN